MTVTEPWLVSNSAALLFDLLQRNQRDIREHLSVLWLLEQLQTSHHQHSCLSEIPVVLMPHLPKEKKKKSSNKLDLWKTKTESIILKHSGGSNWHVQHCIRLPEYPCDSILIKISNISKKGRIKNSYQGEKKSILKLNNYILLWRLFVMLVFRMYPF